MQHWVVVVQVVQELLQVVQVVVEVCGGGGGADDGATGGAGDGTEGLIIKRERLRDEEGQVDRRRGKEVKARKEAKRKG